MRKLSTTLGILGAALTLACSTMTTSVDYDHTVNWSKYSTFQLMEGTKAPTTFTQKRIDDGITQALSAKGWTPTTNNPSILVYSHVVLSQEKQFNTMSMGGWGYRGWGGMGGGMATTTVQNIPIGTLIVDLVDPNTKEMVWRGMAQDQVKPNGESADTINEAMQKLFQNFPPGAAPAKS
jgi:Domain of unknown function (DUF4136)